MNSRMAVITYLDGGGAGPDNTLPGAPVYPLQGLPPGAVQLPVFPFDPTRPDNALPGGGYPSGQPVPPGGTSPDNTLPGSGYPCINPSCRVAGSS